MLHKLPKLVKKKKRVGRGIASRGAKSGRGMKGQKSRAGSRRKAGFEGGQTPLYMRLPKGRGAKQRFSSQVKKPVAIRVGNLKQFEDGAIVGPGQLRKHGFVRTKQDTVKLVAGGNLKRKLTIRTHAVTEAAQQQVEKAGGKVELIEAK